LTARARRRRKGWGLSKTTFRGEGEFVTGLETGAAVGGALSGGWSLRTAGRALLAVSAAALMGLYAQNASAAGAATPAPAPRADDGLGPKDVYVEADLVVDDQDKKIVTATGRVEMRYLGRTLRADKVTYNTVNGVSHAVGHVVIVNEDGTVEYSRDTTLDDQFRTGVALGFAGRLEDNVTMVAGASIKRTETVTELNHGLYTPCSTCQADGVTPRKPTWTIEATRIIEDRDRRVIYYKNAVIRVLGVPVFYAPIFWHPDPTAARQSGLLTPKITYSNYRGLAYSQPYYIDVSPSADLIIDPQFFTRVDPFLALKFKEQFYSGSINLRLGYTYSEAFDSHSFFGKDTSRSYILGNGSFALDPNWTVGFGAERVTDPTLFQRYAVGQVYTDRGPFPTDTSRLISQLYGIRQDANSYFSVAALNFESLRAAVLDNGVNPVGFDSYDTSAAFPTATPIEDRFDPNQPFLDGRLRLTGEAVTLTRSNPVLDVSDPSGLTVAGPQPFSEHGVVENAPPSPSAGDAITSLRYRDSRSADAEANWQSSFTFTSGIRIQPFIDARFDYFSINQGVLYAPEGLQAVPTAAPSTDARALGTVGANFSWPFIKPVGGGSLVLEPLIQLAASNKVPLDPAIPNEDSVSFEFDETNLFEINRFSGYDLSEGGARANVALRATLDLPEDRSASLLIGRTFRTEPDLVFTPQSGLQGDLSDWVTAVSVTPLRGVSLFNRARLDGTTWQFHREEAGINATFGRISGSIRYVFEKSGTVQVDCTNQELAVSATGVEECPSPFGGALVPAGSSVVGEVENLDVSGSWFFTKNWGATVNASRDFIGYDVNGRYQGVWPRVQVAFSYLDDCVRVDLIYTHEEYYSATIGPSDSIGLRLTLTTLGGTLLAPSQGQGSR